MAGFLGNGRFRWKPVGFDFEEVFCFDDAFVSFVDGIWLWFEVWIFDVVLRLLLLGALIGEC